MRRMTKLMAAMLVLTGAMIMVPQKAEASLWGSLLELVTPELRIWNNTGRDVRIRVWTDHGEYAKFRVSHNDLINVYSDAGANIFAIEAAVWNGSQGKYVVKDYRVFDNRAQYSVGFYKYARGEFRLE